MQAIHWYTSTYNKEMQTLGGGGGDSYMHGWDIAVFIPQILDNIYQFIISCTLHGHYVLYY